jgi:hypothetical protein
MAASTGQKDQKVARETQEKASPGVAPCKDSLARIHRWLSSLRRRPMSEIKLYN